MAVLPFLILVAAGRAPQAVVLRYKFQAGSSRRYSMETNTQTVSGSPGQKSGLKMTIVVKTVEKATVKSLGSDGSASLELRIEKQSATMNGQPFTGMPDLSGKSIPLKMGPQGPVTGVTGLGSPSMMAGTVDPSSLQFIGLPKGSVHVGSSWNNIVPLGVEKVTIHNTLSGLTTRQGATVAEIHSTGKVDIGKIASGPASMRRAKVTGNLVLDMHWNFNVTSGYVDSMTSTGPISIDMEFTYGQSGKPLQAQTRGTQVISVRMLG